MGLISKTVIIKWGNNKKWYESKGYKFTKWKDEFEVKVEDLMNGTHILVEVKCDCKDCKNPYLKPMEWNNYLKHVKEDNKYYCHACSHKLYGAKNSRLTHLKNGTSFYDWCIKHNRQDILNRWDYELNKCSPKDITSGLNKELWFKCVNYPQHKSELKNINNFTHEHEGVMNCKQCNSFAMYLINLYGEGALKLYWDYDKNTNNPWEISKSSNTIKVWIKCQKKDYHKSYDIYCSDFTDGNRCPYCNSFASGRVHPLDSLGTLYPQILEIWSNKNKKSPFEYSPFSHDKVWWKCLDNKHDDYHREISVSNHCNFRCPECGYSKGEKRIEEYLMKNNFAIDKDYIPQQEFVGLLGLCNGNLSYDFYLPKHNLLIEYDGEFHYKPISYYKNESIEIAKRRLKKQQEHDHRKDIYAKEHNIKLLRIPYWDFDNIKQILNKELK